MLTGPLSTRNWERRHELPSLDAFSRNAALLAAADQLHAQHPSGFAPEAARLTAKVHQRQLYRDRDGVHYYCLWLTLSNGRKFRAAWKRAERLGTLMTVWERCDWPLKTKAQRAQVDALRRQPRRSAVRTRS